MRVYKTKYALFHEYYDRQVGLLQITAIRNSTLEQFNAARHIPIDNILGMLPLALNLFAEFYEKNPNPTSRLETLADEVGTFTTKQFQKASEFLGTIDPEWEVPVFTVAWRKKKSDINQVIGNPICSICKNELESIGNLFDVKGGHGRIIATYTDGSMSSGFATYTDGSMSGGMDPITASGYDQWLGAICPNCDSIFCQNCCNSGGKDSCPICHNYVIPAVAKDLPIKQNFSGVIRSIEHLDLNQDNDDKVVFVRETKKQLEPAPNGKAQTYTVYRAESAQIARDFLAKHPVNENNNIIIVETPEGNFSRNIDGIYREQ